MTHTICYFIGGPLDLTKTVVARAELQLFALESPALTLSEIGTAQDYKYARDLIDRRHVYEQRGEARVHGVGEHVLVYTYAGLVMNPSAA